MSDFARLLEMVIESDPAGARAFMGFPEPDAKDAKPTDPKPAAQTEHRSDQGRRS